MNRCAHLALCEVSILPKCEQWYITTILSLNDNTQLASDCCHNSVSPLYTVQHWSTRCMSWADHPYFHCSSTTGTNYMLNQSCQVSWGSYQQASTPAPSAVVYNSCCKCKKATCIGLSWCEATGQRNNSFITILYIMFHNWTSYALFNWSNITRWNAWLCGASLREQHAAGGRQNSSVKLKANCYRALTPSISVCVHSESSTAIGPFGLLSVMTAWVGHVLYTLSWRHFYSNNCIFIEASGLPHLAITPIGEMSLVHSFFIVHSY